MNLEELRSVRNTERQKDSLQDLRPSFYQEVGEYIENLEGDRDRVAAQHEDPFASPEVARLTDEIEAAKDVAEAIYERRMGKLVKQASLAAAGMTADSEGLTSEEESLFADLVARIETNKEEILSAVDGRGDADLTDHHDADEAPDHSSPTSTDSAPNRDEQPVPPDDGPRPNPDSDADTRDGESFEAADAMGPSATGTSPDAASERSDAPSSGDETDEANSSEGVDEGESTNSGTETSPDEDVERVTVQITADVGSILGVDDREYSLASDDVVTLPEANADPLIERDAAKSLE